MLILLKVIPYALLDWSMYYHRWLDFRSQLWFYLVLKTITTWELLIFIVGKPFSDVDKHWVDTKHLASIKMLTYLPDLTIDKKLDYAKVFNFLHAQVAVMQKLPLLPRCKRSHPSHLVEFPLLNFVPFHYFIIVTLHSIFSARANPIRDETSLAVVSFDGTVLWVPPGEMEITCHNWHSAHSNVAWHCPLKFGSWTFDGFQIDPHFYGES